MWLKDRRVYRRILETEAEDLIREHGERAYSVVRDGVREARRRGDHNRQCIWGEFSGRCGSAPAGSGWIRRRGI
jgi:hypothetical protein